MANRIPSPTLEQPVARTRQILAALIGNMLVWFDIAIFAFFAKPISNAFFSTTSTDLALLYTFATFAMSFVIRPVGSLVIGSYADRQGRRAALVLSMVLIGIGTLCIALMPSYASVGAVAPIGVFVARMLQGFAAGGEYGASTAYLAELSHSRRGLFASLQSATQAVSGMLAAVFGFGLSYALSQDELYAWGWRIPFFFGALVVPIGLYLRTSLDQSSVASDPTVGGFTRISSFRHWRSFLAGFGLIAAGSSTTYLLSYLPSYAGNTLGISLSSVYACIFAAFAVQIVLSPWAGSYSDKVGRPSIVGAACLMLLLAIPMLFYLLVSARSLAALVLFALALSLIRSLYAGPLPAFLADLFPRNMRATGVAVSYNIGVALFGGTAPFIMEYLRLASGSDMAPAIYPVLTATISLLAVWLGQNIIKNSAQHQEWSEGECVRNAGT